MEISICGPSTAAKHLLLELLECPPELLDSLDHVEKSLVDAAGAVGVVIIGRVFHKFNPQGITGVLLLAESHMAIHTWPERGYAAVDVFTCSDSVDHDTIMEVLVERFDATHHQNRLVERGKFGDDS